MHVEIDTKNGVQERIHIDCTPKEWQMMYLALNEYANNVREPEVNRAMARGTLKKLSYAIAIKDKSNSDFIRRIKRCLSKKKSSTI